MSASTVAALGRMRTFRPLGTETTADACPKLALNNGVDKDIRFDLLALDGLRVAGWCFLWDLDTGKPMFGLGIADDHHGQGLGGTLMDRVMQAARSRLLLVGLALQASFLNPHHASPAIRATCITSARKKRTFQPRGVYTGRRSRARRNPDGEALVGRDMYFAGPEQLRRIRNIAPAP